MALGGAGVVLHCAARVSWDERIDLAARANTVGTQRLFAACVAANQGALPVFVYVSSAFVHGMAPPPHHEEALPICSVKSRLQEASAPSFDISILVSDALRLGEQVDEEIANQLASG